VLIRKCFFAENWEGVDIQEEVSGRLLGPEDMQRLSAQVGG